MTQIVASIESEAAQPPAGLPDDMQALPGASLQFLTIKAIDGFKIQAALWQPEGMPTDITIIVQVHGSGGNLASLPLRVIARALSARGYAALGISTRQHDEHVNTDNFFDVRQDIEAAVVTAKALGFRSIILQGHSLGTVQAAFYAATDWDPTIKAVILTGAFGKLPWKSRHILIQDEERYRALAVASREALKAGAGCRSPADQDALARRGRDTGDAAALLDLQGRAGQRGRRHLLDSPHPAADTHCARRG